MRWLAAWLMVFWIAPAPAALRAAPSAAEKMKAAHEGRAVWRDFPGFHAEIVANRDGAVTKGTLDVAADGKVTLHWYGDQQPRWVERSLASLVNHRLDSGEAITDVEFADDQAEHPRGRLIRSKAATDKSLWRVQDDVLMEVHRITDRTHMIISIGEVTRTKDGSHLPRTYTTTTFSHATGAIESSRQVVQEWQPVQEVMLPTRVLAMIVTAGGERHVEEIVLKQHWLRPTPAKVTVSNTALPDLARPVTSFGAGVSGDHLYVFGGHLGTVHKYFSDDQLQQLLRLNLKAPTAWEVVGPAPRRTGVALVAYKEHLYRIGGWEARNDKGAAADLHSLADFARYSPSTGKWESLTPLPEGRSSHDAALIGNRLFVVGGWQMSGEADGKFHSTAYVTDLDQPSPQWQAIAEPPFLRRAVALAGVQGKLYVIGGMDDNQDTTTAVAVYDPAANAWSAGPALPGKNLDGFAASACMLKDRLYAASAAGYLFRLTEDGQRWEEVTRLAHPRMSHRLVSDGERLFVVGGASRGGKVPQVEMLEIEP